MGIYSWVGAWNLNRQRHCSGQVLRGGQTGCMLGTGGGRAGAAGVGTGFFWGGGCYCCCVDVVTGRPTRVQGGQEVPVRAPQHANMSPG